MHWFEVGCERAGSRLGPVRLAALVGLAATAFCVLATGPARAADTGMVGDITWGISRSDVDRSVALLKDSGAQWVRANVGWDAGEATGKGIDNSTYFANIDYAISAVRAAGIQVEMPIADGVPYWASADPSKRISHGVGSYNPYYRPTNWSDYADFVRYVVNRYKGDGVHTYEVWNEPNLSRFWPSGPNAAQYVDMLRTTYPVIKAADPSATVLMGGLSGNDYGYLQQMYDAGARPYFDAANVHPYSGSADPTLCWNQDNTAQLARDAFCGYREVDNTMARNGDGGKQLWLTEMGFSTYGGDYGVTEAQQADYVTKAYQMVQSTPYVKAMFWYQLRDGGTDPGDWGSHLGLLRYDFSTKPGFDAFKALATAGAGGGGSGGGTGTSPPPPPPPSTGKGHGKGH
jgi:endo-1,4-beta-mannosidase